MAALARDSKTAELDEVAAEHYGEQSIGEDSPPARPRRHHAHVVRAGDQPTEPAADVDTEDASDASAPSERGSLSDAAIPVGSDVAVKGAYDGAGLPHGVLTGRRIRSKRRRGVGHPSVVAQRPDVCAPGHSQRWVDHDPAAFVDRQPKPLGPRGRGPRRLPTRLSRSRPGGLRKGDRLCVDRPSVEEVSTSTPWRRR